MKKLLLFISIVFVAILQMVFATNTMQAPKKLSIHVNLNYQEHHKNGTLVQHALTSTLKTSTNNHKWTAIENKSYNKSNQFVVLVKIEKANSKEITLKFLVLNTDIKHLRVPSCKITS